MDSLKIFTKLILDNNRKILNFFKQNKKKVFEMGFKMKNIHARVDYRHGGKYGQQARQPNDSSGDCRSFGNFAVRS
jgi:hypothetical protein